MPIVIYNLIPKITSDDRAGGRTEVGCGTFMWDVYMNSVTNEQGDLTQDTGVRPRTRTTAKVLLYCKGYIPDVIENDYYTIISGWATHTL